MEASAVKQGFNCGTSAYSGRHCAAKLWSFAPVCQQASLLELHLTLHSIERAQNSKIKTEGFYQFAYGGCSIGKTLLYR
jgi:hypothetical protein